MQIAIACDSLDTVMRLFSCSRRFYNLGKDAHTRASCLLTRARNVTDFSGCLYKACRTGRVDVAKKIVNEAHTRIRVPLDALVLLDDENEEEDGDDDDEDEEGEDHLMFLPTSSFCIPWYFCRSGPLHEACAQDHPDVVLFLLQSLGEKARRASLARTRDTLQLTPMHIACREGHAASVKTLLSFFAHDPNLQYDLLNMEDGKGKTALHLACLPKKNAYTTVKAITTSLPNFTKERWKDSLRTGDNEAVGCLHYACVNGDVRVIKTLVEPWFRGSEADDPCRLKSSFHGSSLFHWLGDRNTDVSRATRLIFRRVKGIYSSIFFNIGIRV